MSDERDEPSQRTPSGAEAAMKTYLLGALFGILLLVGITLLYGVSATTSYADLTDRLGGAAHPDPQGAAKGRPHRQARRRTGLRAAVPG